jgi:biofilm PGA synthesis protein PgaD
VTGKRPLIIERPDLQTLTRRYGYASLTLIFWVAYLYLWLPVVSLLAWWLEAYLVYDQMIVLCGVTALYEGVRYYLGTILLIFVVLIGWAVVNYLRFRGLDRRRAPEPVTIEQVSEDFSVPVEILKNWQEAKSLTIHHDAFGNIISSPGRLRRMQARRSG